MLTEENFSACAEIAQLLDDREEVKARDAVIRLLSELPRDAAYGELINTLVRRSGLLPYVQLNSAAWEDRFACEAFRVDSGLGRPVVLHREQSFVLKKLLAGESLVVSAPTSFGKSFIIDAFIAVKNPKKIVIIVPTIALADETRRRLQSKFGGDYKIITTSGAAIKENAILIFPAERAIGYIPHLNEIDLLVVDEFYKADGRFDRDRAPALMRAMNRLGPRAKQRYFLAPNIRHIEPNEFTVGMEFVSLDFRTVLLEIDHAYRRFENTDKEKEEHLLHLLHKENGKTLVYAGSHASIEMLANSLIIGYRGNSSPLLKSFSSWLHRHYGTQWSLPQLVEKGIGIHSGRLHRFLAQIQVQLFENEDGLRTIISTSSIVEGVNTQAKNVVIWKSKNGASNLDDFTYRNIIGRGGRAFRHFVGHIHLLDKPPEPKDSILSLEVTDDVLNDLPLLPLAPVQPLTRDQIARIVAHKQEMRELLGVDSYDKAIRAGIFVSTNHELLRNIAKSVRGGEWNGIGYLNSNFADNWDRMLFKAIRLTEYRWGTNFTNVVNFVKALRLNWTRTIPEIIALLGGRVGINLFFELERAVKFRLSSVFSDINTMNRMVNSQNIDISPFISKIGHAFLPPVVSDLEEYGLPRMISRKLQDANFINFENPELHLHDALDFLQRSGLDEIKRRTESLTQFDEFLLRHFLDGIRSTPSRRLI